MNPFEQIWNGLDWSVLTDMLLSVIPALFCITIHELSHGYAAYLMGDTTAKDQGRLTLNPIKHIDIFGLAMMVIFKFGWAKPVPINMSRFRNPKRGMAISALAGPASNFVLAALIMLLYALLFVPLYMSAATWDDSILEMLLMTAYLSISLGIFNLLPIPPLDGSKVLFALIPDRAYMMLMRYERYGMLLLMVLLSTGILSTPLGEVTNYIFSGFYSMSTAVINLIGSIVN